MIIPPLPPRPVEVPPGQLTDQWNSMLRTRRFAWAVLYKFDEPLPTTATATRNMTFYYVTLRRTRDLQRFARQRAQTDQLTTTTFPIAMEAEEDMLFPVPWLVNLKLVGNWDPDTGEPYLQSSQLPSEATANPDLDEKGRLVAQMLQPGSVLIDRLIGSIYTVKEHRFTGTENDFDFGATVTLDREITEVDVGLDPSDPNDKVLIGELPPTPTSDLRDFWVFPPSVLPEPNTRVDNYVTFEGNQPVVGVETRQAYLSP